MYPAIRPMIRSRERHSFDVAQLGFDLAISRVPGLAEQTVVTEDLDASRECWKLPVATEVATEIAALSSIGFSRFCSGGETAN